MDLAENLTYTSPETNWGWPSRSSVSCGIAFEDGWKVDP